MSQKKMEAYKEAKKNKRANDKKAKRKKVLGWICGILIAAVVIGASGFLVYYTDVIVPKREAEENATVIDTSDLINFTNTEDGTVEVQTDDADSDNAAEPAEDSAADENAGDGAAETAE